MGSGKNKQRRRARSTHGIMCVALLFLAGVMVRSAVLQFLGGGIVSGCIHSLGALLFAGVGLTLLRDLIRDLRRKDHSQEDSNHGS